MVLVVSVPTDKDFHVWCREMGKKPCEKPGNPGDAIWLPPHPDHRAPLLAALSVPDESHLHGDFTPEERAQLLKKPAPAPKAAPAADTAKE